MTNRVCFKKTHNIKIKKTVTKCPDARRTRSRAAQAY